MIKKLRLRHVRIFEKKEIRFFPGINVLLGKNGAGKTSILEAIYLLNFSKSFKASRDEDILQIGRDYFQIDSEWEHARYRKAAANYVKERGKRFIYDGVVIPRVSDVIGSFPMVLQSPEDFRISAGAGSERRLYFDRFISQISPPYLRDLMHFRKLLKNRNACLKNQSEKKKYHYSEELEIYDQQLSPLMFHILQMRKKAVSAFNRELSRLYRESFDDGSHAEIRYTASLDAEDEKEFARIHRESARKNSDKEVALRRSLSGPNYDKYTFFRRDIPLINFASQGEHKIWLTMLKLAEGEILKKRSGEEPLYLFDDLFAELDLANSRRVVERIMEKRQALISTTDLNDLRRHGIDSAQSKIHIIEI